MQVLMGAPLTGEPLPAQRADVIIMAYTRLSGGNWTIRTKTSSDHITYASSVDTAITFSSASGVGATDEKWDPYLIQLQNGEVWLFFSVVESIDSGQKLYNVYYSTSGDYGNSWTEAVKLTNYTSYGTVGQHPTAVQKTRDTMHVFYDEVRNVLTMDEADTGYCGDADAWSCGSVYYDSTADKAYAVGGNIARAGQKTFEAVLEIDLDTWTITDCWSTSSSPAFPAWYQDNHSVAEHFHHERPYVVVGQTSIVGDDAIDHIACSVLNYVDDSITNYYFMSNASAGTTKNVNWTDYAFHEIFQDYTPMPMYWIDGDNDRLYCSFNWGTTTGYIHLGYLDLTDTTPPYQFTDVVISWSFSQNERLSLTMSGIGGIQWYPEFDRVVVSVAGTGAFNDLPMRIYRISDGAWLKTYRQTTFPSYPNRGIMRGFLYTNVNGEDVIYGGFDYESGFSQSDQRGLCKITLSTDTIEFIRPTTSSIDDYYIKGIKRVDDTLYLTSNTGLYTMDVNTEAWTVINNANTAGFTEDGNSDAMGRGIDYDPTRELILAGIVNTTHWEGLIAVSPFGALTQSQYKLGTLTGSWSFADNADAVQGINDFNLVASLDSSTNSLHAFWVTGVGEELSIKWDRETASFDLTPYLSNQHEVRFQKSIDGTPAKLTFTVSHGHVFDKHNITSLFSVFLLKNRKISLRLGEISASVEYWKNQGSYIVIETSISYQRGQYPTMSVVCEDVTSTWDDHIVIATDNYHAADPEVVIADIVTSHTGFETADLNIPSLSNKEDVFYQWIETPALDILKQLANRYGYYVRLDMDGKFHMKEISNTALTSQSYTDASQIIDYTPDDTFSDFTNEVIVSGEEADFTEVVHDEERILLINGTVGWWGGKEIIRTYYSEDRHRTARNPRVEVIETVKSIGFRVAEIFGGNVEEGIEETDPEEHWVDSFTKVPNLAAALVVAMGIAAAGATQADKVWHPPGTGGGINGTIPIGKVAMWVGSKLAITILASVVNYQHEIWAQPVGKVRRSVQATAEDTVMQTEIGDTITKKFDDPLCNTVKGCQFVADFELMVAQMQRERVKFTKVANMVDEDGDTIEIVHPHSGQVVKVYITTLTRRIKVGGFGSGGHFLDDIEGWVVR